MRGNAIVFGTVFVATLIALALKPWAGKLVGKAA